MITSVITSKAAEDHLGMIRNEYSDAIQGMRDQSIRVTQYNQQKDIMNGEKAKLDAQTNKDNIANMQKQQELELKRMALMEP